VSKRKTQIAHQNENDANQFLCSQACFAPGLCVLHHSPTFQFRNKEVFLQYNVLQEAIKAENL
jgi:hypothetical protein